MGSWISRTWLFKYLDSDSMSIGCLTAPAMMPAPARGLESHGSKLLGVDSSARTEKMRGKKSPRLWSCTKSHSACSDFPIFNCANLIYDLLTIYPQKKPTMAESIPCMKVGCHEYLSPSETDRLRDTRPAVKRSTLLRSIAGQSSGRFLKDTLSFILPLHVNLFL